MPFAYNQGNSIHYKVEGDGEPLVLLHGFLNDLEIWYDLSYVNSLKGRFQLILIDQRGYGQSYKPHEQELYYLTHQVADVICVLDQLNIRKAHIMGYSKGGRVCFGFAKYAPDRIRSLIIGGMHAFGSMPVDLNRRIEMLNMGMNKIVEEYERNYGRLPNNVKNRILANDPKALIADTKDTLEWEGIEEILPRMNMPTLYYVGEDDEFYEGVKKTAEKMPNVNFVSLPNTNHQRAYVRKGLIMQHLLEFLTSIDTSR
jgi:pimeloyl-ACP methyl ester carboxylesterase